MSTSTDEPEQPRDDAGRYAKPSPAKPTQETIRNAMLNAMRRATGYPPIHPKPPEPPAWTSARLPAPPAEPDEEEACRRYQR